MITPGFVNDFVNDFVNEGLHPLQCGSRAKAIHVGTVHRKGETSDLFCSVRRQSIWIAFYRTGALGRLAHLAIRERIFTVCTITKEVAPPFAVFEGWATTEFDTNDVQPSQTCSSLMTNIDACRHVCIDVMAPDICISLPPAVITGGRCWGPRVAAPCSSRFSNKFECAISSR